MLFVGEINHSVFADWVLSRATAHSICIPNLHTIKRVLWCTWCFVLLKLSLFALLSEFVALHKERHVFAVNLTVSKISGIGEDTMLMGVLQVSCWSGNITLLERSLCKITAHQCQMIPRRLSITFGLGVTTSNRQACSSPVFSKPLFFYAQAWELGLTGEPIFDSQAQSVCSCHHVSRLRFISCARQ